MNSVFASAFRGLIGEGSDSQDISPILSGWYLLDKRTSEKTHLDVDLKISRDDEPLFDGDTVDEACEALRIGYNAMYELLNTGKLKAYRNGRVWRIPKVAVQDFILQRVNP